MKLYRNLIAWQQCDAYWSWKTSMTVNNAYVFPVEGCTVVLSSCRFDCSLSVLLSTRPQFNRKLLTCLQLIRQLVTYAAHSSDCHSSAVHPSICHSLALYLSSCHSSADFRSTGTHLQCFRPPVHNRTSTASPFFGQCPEGPWAKWCPSPATPQNVCGGVRTGCNMASVIAETRPLGTCSKPWDGHLGTCRDMAALVAFNGNHKICCNIAHWGHTATWPQ